MDSAPEVIVYGAWSTPATVALPTRTEHSFPLQRFSHQCRKPSSQDYSNLGEVGEMILFDKLSTDKHIK